MIERVDYGTTYHNRLIECPVCHEELEPHVGRSVVADHIADHNPEDFGLSPLRDDDPSETELAAAREGSA